MKSFFRHLNLYQKLCAGYIIFIFIAYLPCAVSLYSLIQLEDMAISLAREDVELTTTIEYLKGLLPSLEGESRRLVTLYKEDSYQTLRELIKDFRTHLVLIRDNGPPQARMNYRYLDQNLKDLQALANEVKRHLPATPPTRLGPLEKQREEQVKELIDQMGLLLGKIEQSIRIDIRTKASQISRRTAQARKLTFIVFVFTLGLALLAPSLLYKYIKRPIDLLQKGTEAIGRGQFDYTITVQARDELGQLAQAFNRMTAQLRELDTLKSEFISVVSHELRTPLASMKEAADLLTEAEMGPLNERQRRLVEILNEGVGRLERFINDLLHLTRLEAKLVPVEKYPHDPLRLVREVCSTLRTVAEGKNIIIEVVSDQEFDPILMDFDRTFRALMNIVHNAIKFSPPGGQIKVYLNSYYDKHRVRWLRIGVVDSGQGIPPGERERIFNKFYQIQAMRHKDGCGLGLAIAKEVIVAQGGRIWVESPPQEDIAIVPGKGSVFWLELPYS